MTTRICFVGNSHLAALKLALVSGAVAVTGADIVFWGAQGEGFHTLLEEDGVLKAPSKTRKEVLGVSGGRFAEIDPDDFDFVFLHGAGLDTFRLVGGSARGSHADAYLSDAFLEGIAWHWLQRKLAWRLATAMKKRSRTPIVFSPMPAPSEDLRDRPPQQKDIDPTFHERVIAALERCVRSRGFGLLRQPESTLSAFANHTRRNFSTRSVQLTDGLDVAHRSEDVLHMNALYGAEVIRAAGRFIREARSAPSR